MGCDERHKKYRDKLLLCSTAGYHRPLRCWQSLWAFGGRTGSGTANGSHTGKAERLPDSDAQSTIVEQLKFPTSKHASNHILFS
jgi:hypothetical protein